MVMQVVTRRESLDSLLEGKHDKRDLVKLEGNRLSLICIIINNRNLYFTWNGSFENGIIATEYDGCNGYIGLPINYFKPEHREEILKQVHQHFI